MDGRKSIKENFFIRKFFKGLLLGLGIIITVVISGLIYLNAAYPKSAPPDKITIVSGEKQLQRGSYLANNIAGCISCHSKRDWTKLGAPVKPGTEGGGGDRIDETSGFPGTVVIKNITPAALSDWSDGELVRAITCGVTKDNKALFPIMPYPDYNKFLREDLYSIIAYIRTLKPINNEIPETKLNFPLNLLVKTLPRETYTPVDPVREISSVERGKYLAKIASCFNCHTIMERGRYREGMDFAGGREFTIGSGVVRSSNITPEKRTGIGTWTKEIFIRRFKYYDTDSTRNIHVGPDDFNTPMPWTMYAGITEEDLGAIFEYLMTIQPVQNNVEKWTPANVTK